MSKVSKKLLKAVSQRAEAKIAELEAGIELMLSKPAAVGEHTKFNYVDDLYSMFVELTEAEAVLDILTDNY